MSDTQEPKPQKINRMDPAWAQFAAAAMVETYNKVELSCDIADAMLRERDRRDREERE